MATHSSILDWRIPWTEESVAYSPWVTKNRTWLKRLSTHATMYLGLGCGFVQSAVTKSYKQGGLLTTEIFLTVLEAGSPSSGCHRSQIPVQTLFPVVDCHFYPCILKWQECSLGPFYKGTNSIYESSTSRPNYSPLAPLPNTVTVKVRISTYELGRGRLGDRGEGRSVFSPLQAPWALIRGHETPQFN